MIYRLKMQNRLDFHIECTVADYHNIPNSNKAIFCNGEIKLCSRVKNLGGISMKQKRVVLILLLLCSMVLGTVSPTVSQAKKEKAPQVHASNDDIVLFAEIEEDGQKIISFGHERHESKVVKVRHIVNGMSIRYKAEVDIRVPSDRITYWKVNLENFKGIKKGFWKVKYKNGEVVKFRILKGFV